MNDPGPACASGHGPTERIFSPTRNIFVPIAFGYTWSDFHDETEKEMARNNPDIDYAHRVASRPSGKAAKKKADRLELEHAFTEAIAITDAKYSSMGLPTDG